MQVSTQIADQEFTFFTWRGTVRTVLTLGLRNRTREILMQARDGARRTVRVQPSIIIEPDHDVSLLYAQRSGDKSGVLVGMLDHTTDRYSSMPQGFVPIRLKPSLFVDIMNDIERYSLPGTALILSVFAAACLFCAGVTYPLLTWFMIGGVLTVLLWAFNELATWQTEVAENMVISRTDEILDQFATVERIANSPEPYDSYGTRWVLEGKTAWTPVLALEPSQRTAQTETYEPRSGYGAF